MIFNPKNNKINWIILILNIGIMVIVGLLLYEWFNEFNIS